MNDTHLVGISGSLRSGSRNTALLRAAFTDLPDGVTAGIVPLDDLPIFNEDRKEHPDVAGVVEAFRATVRAADGIVFASPEYNWSVTGALKNAVDWLSIGPESPIQGKPAAIVGIGGGSGTERSQRHLRDILAHNGLRIVADPQVMVAGDAGRFAGETLVDENVARDLTAVIGRLIDVIEHARSHAPVTVEGSILIVGSSAHRTDAAVRSLTEMGYRTLVARAPGDVERLAGTRRIAAAAIDREAEPATLQAVNETLGGVTRIDVAEPEEAGSAVDAVVRDLRDGE